MLDFLAHTHAYITTWFYRINRFVSNVFGCCIQLVHIKYSIPISITISTYHFLCHHSQPATCLQQHMPKWKWKCDCKTFLISTGNTSLLHKINSISLLLRINFVTRAHKMKFFAAKKFNFFFCSLQIKYDKYIQSCIWNV